MATALVALGSNAGDSARTFDELLKRLAAAADIRLLRVSRWTEYPAVGGPSDQPAFLNAAALLETSLEPLPLLERLLRLEDEFGRERSVRWGQRTVDLDLLLYDRLVCRSPTLELPHPRMAVRRFVLEPAAEIAGSMLHPTIGWSIHRLEEHLRQAVPYMAITGLPGSGKTELARAVAEAVGGRFLSLPSATAKQDHPGSDLSVEIQFVRARCELLARPTWGVDEPWSVSDFWLEQSLAYGRALLAPDDACALEERLREELSRCVRPKLTVLVETPVAPQGHIRGINPQAASEEKLDSELNRALKRRDLGPVLRLAGLDLPQAIAELAAALAGMR